MIYLMIIHLLQIQVSGQYANCEVANVFMVILSFFLHSDAYTSIFLQKFVFLVNLLDNV